MKRTNDHNVPESIVNALLKKEADYDAGAVDSSVTSLIQPARISILRKLYYAEIVKDVSEEFYALLGSGVHHLLEIGATPDMIVEERLFADIDGWRISGAIDVQQIRDNKVKVTDYKVTSTYSLTSNDEPKDEWQAQLNLHKMLIEMNKGLEVYSLNICAILRDWSSGTAKRDPLYPQSPIVMVEIPLWSKQKTLAYARQRIASHRQAKFDLDMGETLEFCTDTDRWVRGDTWAVIKKGGKRATKTFTVEEEALTLLKEKGEQYEVQHRPGRSTRCEYCGVAPFCDQYQNFISKEEVDDSNPLHAEA